VSPLLLSFEKYQGAGNDFILIDDRHFTFPLQDKTLIQKLCHRQKGVGADGIILLQISTSADFRMRVLNADGSEAAMCGNGIRCLVLFIRSLGYNAVSYRIETGYSMIECLLQEEKIVVSQKISSAPIQEIALPFAGCSQDILHLNTGVPHVVIFKDGIENIDVENLGREICNHPHFAPEGANVNFAKIASDDEVHVRTFERGIGETLACGTGAVAVALAAQQHRRLKSPIKIIPRSKEPIEVAFSDAVGDQREVQVVGNAKFVFNGKIHI
jgi:diaminopimelate epimerase